MLLISLTWYYNTIIPTSHQDTDSFLPEGGAPHVFHLYTPLLSLFLLTLCKYKCTPHPIITQTSLSSLPTTPQNWVSSVVLTANRQEGHKMVTLCSVVNLLLNASKTKKMLVAWKENRAAHDPVQINSVPVGRDSFFFGVHVADVQTWHTTQQQSQQRLHFLRTLNRNSSGGKPSSNFLQFNCRKQRVC